MSRILSRCLLPLLPLLAALPAFSQSVSVTPWKDGARGAYSVTMDDFCGEWARGIGMHADSLFHNRNLTFGFGVIVGYCKDADWKAAERLLSHGHEVLNHSWSHNCPRGGTWCQGPGWSADHLAKEIDSSGAVIEKKLGRRPRFFLFPFDIWEPFQLIYLKDKGYLGSRSSYNRDVNAPGFSDPFALNFDALHPIATRKFQAFTLNAFVDTALRAGGWALRETHGVADGSYGALSVAELREHLDYVKAKVDSGLLWVAGPGTVLKYAKQAKAYIPRLQSKGNGMVIEWDGALPDTALFDGELTLSLKDASAFAGGTATQAGKPVKIWERPGELLINARPHRGPVRIVSGVAAARP